MIKTYIYRILFFFMPIALLAYPLDRILSNFVQQTSHVSFAADEFSIWNDLYNGELNADIAVYGSSRAWVHFNTPMMTDSLHKECYNLGIDGHNFWLQYLRHKIYFANNPKPKTILFSVDYSTLIRRTDLYNYYQFMPYMLWDETIYELTQGMKGFDWFDYHIPLWRYVGEYNLFSGVLKHQTLTQIEQREKGYAGEKSSWNGDFDLAKQSMESYQVEIDTPSLELFRFFLSNCKADGIDVKLVYAPIYHEGLQFISNNAELKQLFQMLADEQNFDFWDYSNHPISMDKSKFYNAAHMNVIGANEFTQEIIKALQAN